MEKRRHTFYILVDNQFGVLSRVTGLFSKRGMNIESMHADPVTGTECTKIVLILKGYDNMTDQVMSQLRKLQNVRETRIV